MVRRRRALRLRRTASRPAARPYRRTLRRQIELEAGQDVTGLELRFDAGGALAVRVVESGGQPVPNALVIAGPQKRTTDNEGRARLQVPLGTLRTQVFVDPQSERLLGTPTPLDHAPQDGELLVVLQEAAALAGRVVDPEGKPLGKIVLELKGQGGYAARVVVMPGGSFATRVPAGDILDIRFKGEGASGWLPLEGRLAGAVAGRQDLVLQTRRVATDRKLTVRVITPEGEGVGGIRLRIYPRPAGKEEPTTDDTGRVHLKGLPAIECGVALWRDLRLDCWKRYAPPKASSQSVVPEGQEVVFAFRRANPIRGFLVDAEGQGVSGVVSAYRGKLDQVATALAGEDGAFVLNVPADEPDPVRLEVYAHRAAKRVEDVAPGTDGVRIVLK